MGEMPESDARDREQEAHDPHHHEPGQDVREKMPLPGIVSPHDAERFAQLTDRALRVLEREQARQREMRIRIGGIEFGRGREEPEALGPVPLVERGERLAVTSLGGSEGADLARVSHLLQLGLDGFGSGVGGCGPDRGRADRRDRRNGDDRECCRALKKRCEPRAPRSRGIHERHGRNLGAPQRLCQGKCPPDMLSSAAITSHDAETFREERS